MNGIDLIAAERERQISQEGWTPEHDDRHNTAEMPRAAMCYAATAAVVVEFGKEAINGGVTPEAWPWAPEWWKPSTDPIRNLVKAGALIAAEIDRLQRLGKEAA